MDLIFYISKERKANVAYSELSSCSQQLFCVEDAKWGPVCAV